MSPGYDFVESVEEDSEEAEDDNMEASDSASNSHVSNEHGEGTNEGISHSVLGVVRAVESPVIRSEFDSVVRATGKGIVVVIVSESDSNPEASDDEVILDGKD